MSFEESPAEADALLTYEVGSGESITEAIVTAVKKASDNNSGSPIKTDDKHSEAVLQFDPLYNVIDPDALETLIEHQPMRHRHGDVTVSFFYHDFQVTVQSYDIIRVKPINIGHQ